MRRLPAVLLLTLAVCLTATACAGTPSGKTAPTASAAPQLTLRQQIGQRFIFPFSGTTPPRALVRRIRRGEAAGVILFGRNIRSVAQVREMTRKLQAIPRPPGLRAPLLVMIDQEGGPIRRLAGPPTLSASKMGSMSEAQGAATARLLRRAGVNVNLAPVVDIARPGSAMAAQDRTFGSTAASVVADAGAFVAALAQGRVLATLKHFPGFGAATQNTDNRAVRIGLSLAEMRAKDLVAYERISAPIVMTSTAIYPLVDPAPASFSRRWVTTELRERIGFDGVVITDDLQTPAVTGYGTPSQLAQYAIFAGADIPLFAKRYETAAQAVEGLVRLVREGEITREQLESGARRVLELRSRLGRGAF